MKASTLRTSSAAARPTDDRPNWRAGAACRGADPELFFADGDSKSARAQVKTAKLICRGCPVSAICLNWALTSGQEAGIWGGLTEDQRRRLSRRDRGFRPAADSRTEESHDHNPARTIRPVPQRREWPAARAGRLPVRLPRLPEHGAA